MNQTIKLQRIRIECILKGKDSFVEKVKGSIEITKTFFCDSPVNVKLLKIEWVEIMLKKKRY